MEARATQLSEVRPQVDTPLRISIPVNAPERVAKISRDKFIYENSFSPAAINISKKRQVLFSETHPEQVMEQTANEAVVLPGNSLVNMDHDANIKTAIRDFTMLAFSSKRAGKKDVEATAYASLGVIHDNQGNYLQAIDSYQQYLNICEEIGDVIGAACANNCMGVDYMLLAVPSSDAGTLLGVKTTADADKYTKSAVAHHTKHLEIGPDSGGNFVAHTNLGLCLGMTRDINNSAKHHQDSLRIAIKMQTLYGQSIAVGNLGMLALLKKDFATSRTCFDQHLQLVQALFDPEAEIGAWKLLATLCSAREHHADALDNLEQARKIAEKEGFFNELRRIHCLIGVSGGALSLETFMDNAFAATTEFN
jgi:tetratricopeptide (TPR) repeat protein